MIGRPRAPGGAGGRTLLLWRGLVFTFVVFFGLFFLCICLCNYKIESFCFFLNLLINGQRAGPDILPIPGGARGLCLNVVILGGFLHSRLYIVTARTPGGIAMEPGAL